VDHTRHMAIFQIPSGFSVTLIGAGGIGAVTALTLAKIGVETMDVFDDDVVSQENIPTQLHRVSDIGRLKVEGLAETLRQFSDDIDVLGSPLRVSAAEQIISTLVISAVDSIDARKAIWAALCNPQSNWNYYLDARMGAMEFQQFLIAKDSPSMEHYAQALGAINDSDLPEAPCTAKATFFTAMIAAGHIGMTVANIVNGVAQPHRLVHNIPANWLQVFPY
jgi:hypothetical protein